MRRESTLATFGVCPRKIFFGIVSSPLVPLTGLLMAACGGDDTSPGPVPVDSAAEDAATVDSGGGGGHETSTDVTTSDVPGETAPADATPDGDASPIADGGAKEMVYANAGTSLDAFDLDLTDGSLHVRPSISTNQILQFADFD